MPVNPLSEEERRKLRFAHRSIYLFPILAGLLTASAAVLAGLLGLAFGLWVIFAAFVVNTFMAGLASAYAVARQHPLERGKWWRVTVSFLFAVPISFVSTVIFCMCAACAGQNM